MKRKNFIQDLIPIDNWRKPKLQLGFTGISSFSDGLHIC